MKTIPLPLPLPDYAKTRILSPRTQSGSVEQSARRRRDSSSRRTSRRVRGPECHSANRVSVLLLTPPSSLSLSLSLPPPTPPPRSLAKQHREHARDTRARRFPAEGERERKGERRASVLPLPASAVPRSSVGSIHSQELSTLSRPEPREPLLSSPSSLDSPLTLSSSFDSIPSSHSSRAALPAFRPRSNTEEHARVYKI